MFEYKLLQAANEYDTDEGNLTKFAQQELVEQLQSLGKEGWELVSVLEVFGGLVAFLKRAQTVITIKTEETDVNMDKLREDFLAAGKKPKKPVPASIPPKPLDRP